MSARLTAEEKRLRQSEKHDRHWKRWGPYLSERAWGTVREDYSPDGSAWDFFPHDHARWKAYRWNEDGLGGICDRHQIVCFAVAMWNEQDPILKERLFGLTGPEGNHAEDVKEYYFYLDSTPTHSYMKFLYKYPHAAFPYARLVEENRRRSRLDPEFELMDTGIFDENRYFDVFIEYAKEDTDDILIRITACNRGPEAAPLHLLPTVWFRNTWSWGRPGSRKPSLRGTEPGTLLLEDEYYGRHWLYCDGSPELLFTDNETAVASNGSHAGGKGALNEYVVHARREGLRSDATGTRATAHYRYLVRGGESVTARLRLTKEEVTAPFSMRFENSFTRRVQEADEFYATVTPTELSSDGRSVMRQAFAGMLWSKQFYHYVVEDWLHGDPASYPPPDVRRRGRNHQWTHLHNADVISMCDKWEYPWYAAWDLAFHCLPLSLVDADFAKEQLILLLREWYMHPNGQLPAYEWALGDVNPPVHAWAAYRVFKIEQKRRGKGDFEFLERVFHKLLLNFTWWVNRKDAEGNNIFQGGFLGMDNVGLFDRSAPLPTGGFIEQSDGSSWMAMYTLNLLAIALELARHDPAYEDVASKFYEHFVYISHSINTMGLWDEEDGLYYDVLHLPDNRRVPMRVRSMVGLIPLFAVQTLEARYLAQFPGFSRRMKWFLEHRPEMTQGCACMRTPGQSERRLLSIVNPDRLRRVLSYMLDENEFLSPYGIRSLSRCHHEHPYVMAVNGTQHRVQYEPAESSTGLFGGNSNWRGPIWFPVNYLLIESLQKFHHYLGDGYRVECPTGSGQMMNLWEVAAELSRRLTRLFLRDDAGRRPVHGNCPIFQTDPHWRDHCLFYEYFNGDTGAGLGASHQTGWTGLVTKLLQQSGE